MWHPFCARLANIGLEMESANVTATSVVNNKGFLLYRALSCINFYFNHCITRIYLTGDPQFNKNVNLS